MTKSYFYFNDIQYAMDVMGMVMVLGIGMVMVMGVEMGVGQDESAAVTWDKTTKYTRTNTKTKQTSLIPDRDWQAAKSS